MAKVLIHATITLDGFMADTDGGVDWMFGFDTVDEDFEIVSNVTREIGAIVAGANKTQSIEDDELPYGGSLGVPVFLMTRSPHDPIIKDGVTYTFVVDDIGQAIAEAKDAAGDKYVSLLGGKISRECLRLGLVDEIQLHVVPLLLGEGISLFAGLGESVHLERMETLGYANETHLRFRVVG